MEAVDGQTVVGEAEGLFGLGGGRACCFGDNADTLCGGGVAIVVIIEHRRQPGAQVPFTCS